MAFISYEEYKQRRTNGESAASIVRSSSGNQSSASQAFPDFDEYKRLRNSGQSAKDIVSAYLQPRQQTQKITRHEEAEAPVTRRASSAPIVPEIEQRRQSTREAAGTARDQASKTLQELRGEKDRLTGNITDEYTAAMYADKIAELDRQIAEASKNYKAKDQEYKDVYADYNAARKELRQAEYDYSQTLSEYGGKNYEQNVKDAETRLANARRAFEEQGGNPDASVIGANAKSWAGQQLGTLRYFQELNRPENAINLGPITIGGGDDRMPAEMRAAIEAKQKADYEAKNGVGTWKPAYQRTEETAARMQRESAEDIASIKAGRSQLGQVAVDVAGQSVQMGLDAAFNAGKVIPGGSLTSMALRTFGASAQEAKDQGATIGEQGLYGAGSAAVEVLTEKMFDGLAGVYGAGAADDIVSHMIGKITDNRLGQAALEWAADALGEGLEEVASDAVNPLLQTIYNDMSVGESYRENLDWQEVGYDFLIGALMGFAGGSVENVANITGITAPDERSDFFMQAGQSGMSFKDAMNTWHKHMIKEGYATKTSDQEINNQANEYLNRLESGKRVSERKINKLNQRATNTIAQEDIANTVKGVQQRMQQFGINDPKLAQAITALALENEAERIGAKGVGATEAQHEMVEGNSIASRILSEMDVENMRREQAAGYINTLLEMGGASDEELQRNMEPYQRTNEWAKNLKGNKALAADVYGTQNTVTEAEKNAVTMNGESVKIVGAENGKVIVEQNGERQTVDAGKLENMSDSYKQLVSASPAGQSGEAFLRLYKPGQDVAAYAKAWDLAENMYGAQTNVSFDEARQRASLKVLTDAQLQMALDIGRERYNANKAKAEERGKQLKQAREEAKKRGAEQRKKGTVSYDGGEVNGVKYKGIDKSKLSVAQKRVVAMVEALADAVNIDYVLFEGEANTGGSYIQGGTVYINIKAGEYSGKTLGAATLSHELTHFLQDFAPEEYQELKDFLIAEILKQSPAQFEKLVQKQLMLEPDLNYDQATDEMIANACQKMLLNSEAVTKLARQNMNLAEKIRDAISEISDKIKAAFEDVDMSDNVPVFEAARSIENVMDKAQALWDKALEAASENYNAQYMTLEESYDNGSDVQQQYNTKIDFIMENDKVENEKELIPVRASTPKVILDSEKSAKDLPMYIRYDAAYLAARKEGTIKGHYHDIGDAQMKQIPAKLENPIMMLKLDNGRINSIIRLTDKAGRNVLASVELNAYGLKGKEGYNLIVTVMGASDNYIRNLITEHNAKIIYKTEEASHFIAGLNNTAGNDLDASNQIIANESEKSNTEIGNIDLKDYSKAKGPDGKPLFQILAFQNDEPQYREMLTKWGGMTDTEINRLFETVDSAMNIIKGNLEALDYAWEADIDDRAFSPVKPNSDKLYKVSQDFSTLCRKRILQGLVANHLQAALDRSLTREEGIAIRDALIAIQKEGKQIEVACALCYVESARMRSPAQIQRFLDNRERVIRDYFTGKDKAGAKLLADEAERKEREAIYTEEGMVRGKGADNTMYDVRDAKTASLKKLPGYIATRIRNAKKAARAGYALTAEQQAIINTAKDMSVTDFTTPEGLENLAKNHREIFDAYTSFIRNATKSKGIENDTWWRAGDSASVSDLLIEQMNAENGLRSQSWSDFQVKHLMDYIAATIEFATRGAKQQAYSKVIDYVDLMGMTNVMINMSLIPTREFNGKLAYDDVEGFVYKKALELRDKYHATAGTICIGIDNQQIIMLLADDKIDYVIPYHRSGMAAHIRAAMHIPQWSEYEAVQNEQQLTGAEARANAEKFGVKLLDTSDPNWHVAPKFSDWFDLKTARQEAELVGAEGKYGVMTGGYAAMKKAADLYLKLCAERGLAPKFGYGKADFTSEENYWKLLIDRKMVDNVTGEIIEQKAIKPIFDMNTIQRILNDELERYGKVKEDQNEAIRRVTEAFLGGKLKGGMTAEEIEQIMQKPVDNISVVNITQNADGVKQQFQKLGNFSNKAEIDAEIDRVQDQIRDIQNAQWRARDNVKADPRVKEAQEKLWAAEDAKGRAGALPERREYNRIYKEVEDELNADIPEGDLTELADRVAELKELREQFINVTPITRRQYDELAKHFGTTDDYAVAGFILQDGRMLDFSGKKQYGRQYAGGREVYHNEVGDVIDLKTDTSPRIEMVSNGNIRLVPEVNGINLSQKPTAQQKDALRGFIEYHNGDIHVDIDNTAGSTLESFGYYKGASASKILSDIDNYFKTGEAPKPQSIYRSFYQKLGIGETAEEQQARKESFDNLKAENKILRARAEYWKAQTRTTKERTVRQQDTDRLARELLKKYESRADRDEVKTAMKALGDWLVQTDELDYNELYARAEAIAEDIISGNYALLDNSQQENLDRLKDYLKNTPVNLSKSDFRDTGDEGFRKKYGRYFTVSERGRTIDSLWGEMTAMFGEGVFPEDVYAPGDMLNMIADYLDMWKPQYGNEFEMFHDEAVNAATNEIIDAILSEDVRQTPGTFADKAQQKLNSQIAKDRERLDALREAKNARIEELKRQASEKNAQIRLAEKAAKYEAVSKVKQHYQDMLTRQRNKRGDTKVRAKIKKLHKELSDILLKPKEGRYVPRDLVKATAEILGAVDTTSGRAVKAKAAFAELKVKYDALAKDQKYALTYDETVSGMLQSLVEELGDGSIYDLTGTQLEGVYNVLKSLKHTIVTANKLVGAKIEADAFEAANEMMHETESAKGIPNKLLRRFVMAQLTPSSAFRMFGGYKKNSMWEQMFNELNNGQLTQTQILMEGGQIFRELIDDKKNMAKLHDQKNLVDIGLKDDQGNAIKVTRGMMLSVYMHLLNEQNARHVAYGGLTVPQLKQYYKNQMKDAFNGKTGRAVAFATEIAELNEQLKNAETVEEQEAIKERLAELNDQTDAYMSNLRAQIEEQLTDYDRKWIAAAQEFFDVYSKGKLNEVTEMIYGFEKAQVDNYFPIHTDPDYRAASFDTIVRDMNLENAGFMKERVNGANPILLEDITDVISSQLRRTAQYVGLMPAIRNFNKVYGKARAGYSMSVQSAMARTFENEGKKYIENLMADLNGARKGEPNIFDELRGRMAGAVLTLNPRVTLSQAASFPSAAAEIGYKPLMKALTDMKNPMWNKGLTEEIAKWTPLWWYRMQGFSTTELGDIKNNEQFMNRVMDKMKWATGWIQAADGLTTGGLWQASQYYVDDNFSDLEKGSGEYMMKVAEVYNRVLEKTQPDYTTMQRPDILRNPNAIVKQLTMFMTQRLQNTNILYDAAATYSHYVRDLDAGRNGVTAADVKQAKTRLAWAVSSQVAAGATIVIFKAIADAIMHNLKAYRDDDDELTAESVSRTLLTNFIETLSGNILWGSERFSWMKSAITGERYYGVSLNGVDTFKDVLEDGNKLVQKAINGDADGAMSAGWKLFKAIGQFFGAPLANGEKFYSMTKNYIEDVQNGTFMEAGVDRTRAQNTHLLFNALQSGDGEKATRIRATFKDKKDEQAALKSYIQELYTGKDQKIQKAETIKLLQQYAGMTKREAEDLAQKWTMEVVTGIKFSELQDKYISGEIQRMKAEKYYKDYSSNGRTTEAEAKAKVLEWTCEKETGIAYSDIGTEVKTRRLSAEKAIQMVMKYGGKDKDAATKIVNGYLIEHEYDIKPSELEDEYMAGNVSDGEALEILLRYRYYGKDEAEKKATEELERMRFVKANPDAEDISVTQVRNYQAAGLKGIVSASTYAEAAKMMGTFHGVDADNDGKTDRNSIVIQKLEYIDTLDLTPEAKTRLAQALGISEKNIRRRAPWR